MKGSRIEACLTPQQSARLLMKCGFRSGDPVAFTAEVGGRAIVELFGNLLAGVVSVPLNPKLGAKEREHVLGDSGAVFVDEFYDRAPDASSNLLRRMSTIDPAFVLYTSGTTGSPKGAVIRASSIAANIDALSPAWRWSDADVLVHALPIFHVHGLILGARAASHRWRS
ncbi:MAG: AMP-binding protein [Polyangiales bacterium]